MALPYPINRVADASVVVMMLAVSVVFGAYTFLDILCIQRAPRLAFNFDYWQGQQFARLWKAFGGLAGKKVKPIVSSLASVASKVVLDIGSVVYISFAVSCYSMSQTTDTSGTAQAWKWSQH